MKRIFAKNMAASLPIDGVGELKNWGAAQWLMQEDITVVSFELVIQDEWAETVDCWILVGAELSPVAVPSKDGCLGHVASFKNIYNSGAGRVQTLWNGIYVVYPDGYGITMREGESLFINLSGRLVGTVGNSYFTGRAIVNYVKGI